MSIAVRASVLILGLAVVVSATLAVWALLQRQNLTVQNQNLKSEYNDDESKLVSDKEKYQTLQGKFTDDESQLADLKIHAKKLEDDADQLNSKVSQAEQEKEQALALYNDLKQKSQDFQAKLDQANSDRDDWKNRVQTISRERDDLMQKLKNGVEAAATAPAADNSASAAAVDVTTSQGDQYWAGVLRQKAALQVELTKESSELDQAALQVVDLKKQNSDLGLEVKQLNNEKDDIIQKIKYGQDLADNLSIDLARSRNYEKAVNARADKLKEENFELLSQIRSLSSAKLELEQNVSRLSEDKDAMQKKLIETESIIQGRIDDIWKIKESLDKKLSENSPSSSSGSMELPPIVVNAPNNQQQSPPENTASASMGKTEGSIISINESNNFVIVDLGQVNSSVSVGNPLKVYRDSNEIASLEVIQVRRDICAADIKNKTDELRVGDIVRL